MKIWSKTLLNIDVCSSRLKMTIMLQSSTRGRKVSFGIRVLPYAVGAMLLSFLNPGAVALITNSDLPAKIIRQYALTSANDFPQRDPMDWRFLGSNDGGKSWIVLDERKGVIFSKRNQRQLFKISNQKAFNMYRLEIDRIRKPSEANSVQLAELEPLGETQDDLDPVPIFADRITAQGDNPNLEKVFNAFDNQNDTKWLDFADQFPDTRSSWIQWQYTDHTDLVITNIAQLAALHSQAAKKFPVRIAGWIIGPLETVGQWCLMDSTGNIGFQASSLPPQLSPGQRVCVEGVSGVNGHQLEIADARVTQQAPTAPSVPSLIHLGAPLTSQDEMRWVQISGKIGFVGHQGQELNLELEESGNSV